MAALAAELGLTGSERASLRDIVPALASWRRHRRSWYRLAWRPVPEPAAPVLSGTWLVVVPEDGTDEKLAAAVTDTLTRYGATPVVLTSGELLGSGDLAAALLRELGAGAPGPAGALLLPMPGEGGPTDPDPAEPDGSAAVRTTARLLSLLDESGIGVPAWLLTREAVPAGHIDETTDLAQAALWGLSGRPLLTGGLVDLPMVFDSRARGRLAAVLAGPHGEREVAIRPSGIFARRLVASSADGAGAGRWSPHGTVLVHGGTHRGGPGAEVVRWLAGQGAEELLLTGGADADAVREVVGPGCRVTVAPTGDDALAALISGLPAECPVTAVVVVPGTHPGESLDDGLDAMKALWTLHRLTRSPRLETFVVLTALEALIGAPGAGAAATTAAAFGEALIRARRRDGLPGTLVAWGPRADGPFDGPWSRPAMPGATLARLPLSAGGTGLVVADIDWNAYAGPELPVLADLLRAARGGAAGGTGAEAAAGDAEALRARLAATPEGDRRQILLDLVGTRAAAVLATGPGELDTTLNFLELGFTSLTVLELCNGLREDTGIEITPDMVLERPTPLELAAELETRLVRGLDQGGPR